MSETSNTSDATKAGKHRPAISRAQLEQTKSLLLMSLSAETDEQAITEGVDRLASINASLRRHDDVDAARGEFYGYRKEYRAKQEQTAIADQQKFKRDVYIIAVTVLERDYKISLNTSDDAQNGIERKTVARYHAKLLKTLSFGDALKQVDEILTAARQQRPWKALIELPKPELARLTNDGVQWR